MSTGQADLDSPSLRLCQVVPVSVELTIKINHLSGVFLFCFIFFALSINNTCVKKCVKTHQNLPPDKTLHLGGMFIKI